MALVPVGALDHIGMELWGRIYGQETRTRFVYQCTTLDGEPDPQEVVENFVTDNLAELFAELSADFSVYNIRVRQWDGLELVHWEDQPQTLVGLQAGAAVPPSVAWCVKKRTGLPGRTERGRWYFPGLPAAYHIAGEVDPAQRVALDAAVAELEQTISDDVTASIFTPRLIRYGPAGDIVTTFRINIVEPTWILRSQRRREIGVGI